MGFRTVSLGKNIQLSLIWICVNTVRICLVTFHLNEGVVLKHKMNALYQAERFLNFLSKQHICLVFFCLYRYYIHQFFLNLGREHPVGKLSMRICQN